MFPRLFLAIVVLLCCAARLPAATQAQIDQALQRGVAHLKSTQGADGSWDYAGHIRRSRRQRSLSAPKPVPARRHIPLR